MTSAFLSLLKFRAVNDHVIIYNFLRNQCLIGGIPLFIVCDAPQDAQMMLFGCCHDFRMVNNFATTALGSRIFVPYTLFGLYNI